MQKGFWKGFGCWLYLGLMLNLGPCVQTAHAADADPSCCTDLDERVAALEDTIVRKGTRTLSLTVSGHVNRGVLWYNDGSLTGFRSVDTGTASSRFRMIGRTKIDASWSAGYYLEFEFVTTGSYGTDQISSRLLPFGDGFSNQGAGSQPNTQGNSPLSMGIRQSHWWVKNEHLGTVSVGHLNSATKDFAGTDTGGIGLLSNVDMRGLGANLFLRRQGTTGREGLCAPGLGCSGSLRWGNFTGSIGDNFRIDGIRYDTPTLYGFTFSAAAGDDFRWDVALRYAGSWNGLSIAAAVGYIVDTDELSYAGEDGVMGFNGALTTNFLLKGGNREQRDFKLNASVRHEATGIFVSGAFWNKEFHGSGIDRVALPNAAGFRNDRPDVKELWGAVGIRRNVFGIGDTSVYGSYGLGLDPLNGLALNMTSRLIGGGANLAAVSDSSHHVWGTGVLQRIDAADMILYLGYQHEHAAVEGCVGAISQAACSAAPKTQVLFNDLSVVLGVHLYDSRKKRRVPVWGLTAGLLLSLRTRVPRRGSPKSTHSQRG